MRSIAPRPPQNFIPLPSQPLGSVTYQYQGICPFSEATLTLPRTTLAEALAQSLTCHNFELCDKMLGILIVEDAQGNVGYGKAYSGQTPNQKPIPGWVPALCPPRPLPTEASTITALAQWKTKLQHLIQQKENHSYPSLKAKWHERELQLKERHRLAKSQRDDARRRGFNITELQTQSQQDSRERQDFKKARRRDLAQTEADYYALCQRLDDGRRQRRELSRSLQLAMHQDLSRDLESILGVPMQSLFPNGIPTGTGDCCAPKLLGWAAHYHLRPLALAEIWWDRPTGRGRQGKHAGQFYPACLERCQPLLGPLLAVALRDPVRIVYQDPFLTVVNKPSGLLTVAGRYPWNQECLLTHLDPGHLVVHRLDLDTSGLIILARDAATQADLSRQFEKRLIHKVYEAELTRPPACPQGSIRANLSRDPEKQGRYQVNPDGKLAVTDYRMLSPTRIELRPLTGRSHQLRVHMASVLACPIRGDRLYGIGGERLKLHAQTLGFTHPQSKQPLCFTAPTPF